MTQNKMFQPGTIAD